MQKPEELVARISSLGPQKRAIVRKLLERLELTSVRPELILDEMVYEFQREHSELLRLLAQ